MGFIYKDGNETANVNKAQLLEVLSNGEKKALYILNVLFEVETRKNEKLETLIVVDDLADSFDYQNKYAIIQYLKDISVDGLFKLIIMTHNFDFFRTVANRFVGYGNGLMASKNDKGVSLVAASGINNPFVNIWKKGFFTDQKQKIASISFLRNLIEMTVGSADPAFLKLTSLLHWKADTKSITVGDLDAIYNKLCGTDGKSANATKPVYEVIDEEAGACALTSGGMNLENKIVLSIGIRLLAERFMIAKINDDSYWKGIKKDQTAVLKTAFDKKFKDETDSIAVLDSVVLMTPENIHLNSFMFEPLIDMSDDHLRRLYNDVKKLA